MIAYSKEQLDRISIMRQASLWLANKRIQKTTFDTISKLYTPDLYSPNLFIRIGLLIFTTICLSAGNSIIFLLTGFFDNSMSDFSIRFIIHGILMYILLEALVKEKKLYKSGIDDAILYASLSFILIGVINLFSDYNRREVDELLLACSIALPFLVVTAIRYTDMLLSALSFGCFFSIFFLLLSKTGESSKFTLPFLIMITASGLYFILKKIGKNEAYRYWESCITVLEVLSLLLIYLAGNYFVIRTLSEELFNLNLEEGQDIPLAFFFYTYTILIPILYIFYGLKNKTKTPIYVGLLTIALSVFTFKYYYSLGHHEITLTIGGIIMIAIAWSAIRYLRTPQYGITYKEDVDESLTGILDTEALIIAQSFSNPISTQDNGTAMGDGSFGGGGADGKF